MSRTEGTGQGPRLSALGRAENVLLGTALVATALVVLAQIVFRFVLREPLSWATEVATDLLVWTAFLGLAVGVRDNAHVAMALLEGKLSSGASWVVRVGQQVVLAFLLGALCYGGIVLMLGELHTVSASGVPRWMVFAAVPAGSGLALLHVLAQVAMDHVEPAGGDAPPQGTEPAADRQVAP